MNNWHNATHQHMLLFLFRYMFKQGRWKPEMGREKLSTQLSKSLKPLLPFIHYFCMFFYFKYLHQCPFYNIYFALIDENPFCQLCQPSLRHLEIFQQIICLLNVNYKMTMVDVSLWTLTFYLCIDFLNTITISCKGFSTLKSHQCFFFEIALMQVYFYCLTNSSQHLHYHLGWKDIFFNFA